MPSKHVETLSPFETLTTIKQEIPSPEHDYCGTCYYPSLSSSSSSDDVSIGTSSLSDSDDRMSFNDHLMDEDTWFNGDDSKLFMSSIMNDVLVGDVKIEPPDMTPNPSSESLNNNYGSFSSSALCPTNSNNNISKDKLSNYNISSSNRNYHQMMDTSSQQSHCVKKFNTNSNNCEMYDSEPAPPKKACLVCGDIASGFHYGILSCEACKAFFKRTVQGSIDYCCPAHNNCEITKRRRKACQACRYQKCIHVGMMKEGVRPDRVRGGRQKYPRRSSGVSDRSVSHDSVKLFVTTPASYCQTSSSSTSSGTNSLTSYSLKSGSLLSPAGHTLSSFTTSLVNTNNINDNNVIIRKLMKIEPPPIFCSGTPISLPGVDNEPETQEFAALISLADRELVITIGWAKEVPGFADLSLSDQMNLLRNSWMEILLLGIAHRSMDYDTQLVYAQDLIMDCSQPKGHRVDDLNSTLMCLSNKLRSVGIDKEEFVLLKAIVLCNGDSIQLDDENAVLKIQDSLHDAFVQHVTSRHAGETRRLPRLLMCLPLLRQTSARSIHIVDSLRKEGRVPMNKLFLEMLEAKL